MFRTEKTVRDPQSPSYVWHDVVESTESPVFQVHVKWMRYCQSNRGCTAIPPAFQVCDGRLVVCIECMSPERCAEG
jgi:hypothetical protein